jgi:hypothetical protein
MEGYVENHVGPANIYKQVHWIICNMFWPNVISDELWNRRNTSRVDRTVVMEVYWTCNGEGFLSYREAIFQLEPARKTRKRKTEK